MKRINEHIFLSFLAVLTLLCTACITGGWEECPEPANPDNLIIQLDLQPDQTLPPPDGTLRSLVRTYASSSDWQNATLFVLTKGQDGKDSVVATRRLDVPQPQKLSVKELELTLDTTYSFAVWFNLKEKGSDNEALNYIHDEDTVYMQLPERENDSITIRNTMDKILPFFHGLAEQHRLHSTLGENNVVPITVVPQTNVLHIKVFGENVKPKNNDPESYKFIIKDRGTKYSLGNKTLESPDSVYYVSEGVSPEGEEKDIIQATMRVLKLSDEPGAPEASLTVVNEAGRLVFGMPDKTSLVALILQSWQLSPQRKEGEVFDISLYHTFYLDINLDGARGVTITVNDWGEVEWDSDITLDL